MGKLRMEVAKMNRQALKRFVACVAFVALAAAAAVAVFGGAVVGCASSAASGRSCELRLMSYNIRHCKGMDGKVDVQRVAGICGDKQNARFSSSWR